MDLRSSNEAGSRGAMDREAGGAGGNTWVGCSRRLDTTEVTHQGVPLAEADLRACEADGGGRLVGIAGHVKRAR